MADAVAMAAAMDLKFGERWSVMMAKQDVKD
jgi:hypothetical protein